jgi:Eco29kI restriction endonuclease
MFESFPIPDNIERELVAFYKRQVIFPLTIINPRKQGGDESLYRAELSRHYGVYVLYYTGTHPLYADIAERNSQNISKPIYVGKAVSSGSRIGNKQGEPVLADSGEGGDEMTLEAAEVALSSTASAKQSNSLFKRLNEHSNNLKTTRTLEIDHFQVRVIPMADAMVQWAEATMIGRLRPIWNARISGFGNHDPGSGRYKQARSIWDQLHPGRTWAERLDSLAPYDEEALRHNIRMTLDIDLSDKN